MGTFKRDVTLINARAPLSAKKAHQNDARDHPPWPVGTRNKQDDQVEDLHSVT